MLEQVGRPAGSCGTRSSWHVLGLQRELDVAADGLVRIQGVALEHHGDLAGPRRQPGHGVAVDEDIALGRLVQAGDGAQQRRLAAPRRAEQDEVLALLGRQVDAVDGPDRAVAAATAERGPAVVLLDQVPDLDDRHRQPTSPWLRHLVNTALTACSAVPTESLALYSPRATLAIMFGSDERVEDLAHGRIGRAGVADVRAPLRGVLEDRQLVRWRS